MGTFDSREIALDQIVTEQVKKWETETKRRYKKPIRPVITIARLPGSGAETLAKQLSADLQLDLFDHEIVEEVAKNAHVSKSVIESLDEQDRNIMDDWIGSLQKKIHLWPDEYLSHLTRVITAIGAHGHAVIVGRGTGFILPNEVCLRLLLVAPRDVRVNNVKQADDLTFEEAEKRVMKLEKDRKSFVKKYFNAELTDPTNYDLTINTANFNVDTTVDIIRAAFNARKWYDYSMKK
jgi:cytidylate kinase